MERIERLVIDDTMRVQWYRRLLNLVIDAVMILMFFLILGFIGGIMAAFGYDGLALWFERLDGITDRIVTTLVMVVYLFTMEVLTQRTVGKYLTGTMVVMEDGSKPAPRAIMIRALCRIIGLEVFSFISAVPRGWHDTASDTVVVDAKKYKEAVNLKRSFNEIGMDNKQEYNANNNA